MIPEEVLRIEYPRGETLDQLGEGQEAWPRDKGKFYPRVRPIAKSIAWHIKRSQVMDARSRLATNLRSGQPELFVSLRP
ncbi:hypothetical protein RRG08_045334 [Elysia crispata]|uniref:Uncharacterized protein n=1 Tax=Elysia crispata TaxID=231223 RepID=A0AAE1A1G9_9GAST|nr:hypothetical protein RRG08_045334 [Elysia crispata]